MRRLTLLRHASAEPAIPAAPSDATRCLTPAGQQEARTMAQIIARELAPVPYILTSTAVRARTTAEIVAGAFEPQAEIECDEKAYAASPGQLLEIITRQQDHITHVMLCAHNPGISTLAARLARDKPLATLAPCGLASLCFEAENWGDLLPASGRVTHYWRSPRI